MRRVLPILVVLTAAMVTAQTPSPTATIEAVSVKRNTSGVNGAALARLIQPTTGRIVVDRIERPTED